jgi:hypothetical protein
MSCLFSNRTLQKTPNYPLVHPRPTLTSSPLHTGNQIGDAGAAAVASALEPRRNGDDGSWTPSTALTMLYLAGEWSLISMVVTEGEWSCSCVSIIGRPLPFRVHKQRPSVRPNLLINIIGSILSTHPICILSWLKGTKSAMLSIGGHTFHLS